MNYFTQRNGMRNTVKKTNIISSDMYALIFDCCERYYDNIAWKFSKPCPDGNGCCGLDFNKFDRELKFEIPTLYRNFRGVIDKEVCDAYDDIFSDEDNESVSPNFDQYALLDFTEFMYQNIKDFKVKEYHSFFKHNHIDFLETKNSRERFRSEINEIFNKVGLLYQLKRIGNIERVVENIVLTNEIEQQITKLTEKGLQDLLDIAIQLYKSPKPTENKLAVEKIWDALENLKLYFKDSKKKQENQKIADILSGNNEEIFEIFDKELNALGNIGNRYHIRHYNEQQKQIVDDRHYDYFFNRCLSLVALAIQYLK